MRPLDGERRDVVGRPLSPTVSAVSYATHEPDYAAISGLTYGTITAEHRSDSRGSWDNRDIIASAAVLVAIVAAYLYFSG